ncbi:melanocyte protein PMEL isoform X2 [Rhinatrema bivittatum]|uniref:melanocyte protein PMEL isoform X2 n=1 Tax=Rhinatrema bivittatum TaxID=194408 RepID=UPI00112D1BAB|nr:melanocyte protein PMEL isoform X2 [Rhinatrema bivittatum]
MCAVTWRPETLPEGKSQPEGSLPPEGSWRGEGPPERGGRGRSRQSQEQPPSPAPFKGWNSQLYPVWQDGDPRQRDCWKGGQVMLEVSNDAPTLASAKVTFSIKLQFPHDQTVLADGQVVWNQNRTANGTHATAGDPVFPSETSEGLDCVFPDGSPFPQGAEKKRSKFIYVWQAWGKYWQVVDGPLSLLTIDTEDTPLGSYTMEVIVYHSRGRQRFVPLGRATSQFSITDQIPLSVEISQIMDLDGDDKQFVQNRPISFQVQVHDPSQYLRGADLSYSWDFGDQSGTLISHSGAVTHAYTAAGSFRSQLILQAAIPLASCGTTSTGTIVVITTEPAGQQSMGSAVTADPSALVTAQGQTTAGASPAAASPSDQPVTPTGQEPAAEAPTTAVSASSAPGLAAPTAGSMAPAAAATPSTAVPAEVDLEATLEGSGTPASSTDANVTTLPVSLTSLASLPISIAADSPILASTAGAADSVALPGSPEPTAATGEAQPEAVPTAPSEALQLEKRQAPEGQAYSCLLYRYGSFSATLDIVQGIESVEIIQVLPLVASEGQNTVDFTVTCQGSIPQEACTIISDPDCLAPQQKLCGPVEPSADCQLVLHQIFNDSGVYCVNVSLTNEVSLAMASTQVSIGGGVDGAPRSGAALGIGVLLVVIVLVAALVAVAYIYRHMHKYSSLPSDATQPPPRRWIVRPSPLFLFFQNIMSKPTRGESSPLLHGSAV